MSGPAARSRLEQLLAHDRAAPAAGLAVVVALAWLWLAPMAADMYGSMSGSARWMMAAGWDGRYALLVFLMWVVMMVGMMLPSAAPVLLMYGPVARSGGGSGAGLPVFVLGYLLTWTAFSALATAAQWLLAREALLSPMMQSDSRLLNGALLIVAGIYQWTPLKNLCLTECRSPAHTLTRLWRPGLAGALRMGLGHGLYCVGCCWALMALLFVGGVMNLAWIVVLTLFVLAEKAFPRGAQLGRVAGPLLIGAGAWMVITTLQSAGPG